MKTPLSYWGGKQRMLKHILPLIPEHDLYTEAFAGGLAVYFAKEPAKIEVINDLNGEVMNFYEVLCTDYLKLNRLVQTTLHNRRQYQDAIVMHTHPHLFDPIQRAWALWILSNQGFANKIGSWGYDKLNNEGPRKLINQKLNFSPALRNRLERTQIESQQQAWKIISSRDREGAFHYLDNPYINTTQAHYSGYSEADFERDLQILPGIKGKFLLSSFESQLLQDYIRKNGWHCKKFNKPSTSSRSNTKRKIEVLTANYDLDHV